MGFKPACQKACEVSCFMILVLLLAGVNKAGASVDNVKTYKKAFPEAKPKCMFCHTEKLPKKEDGLHDLNAYGLKIKETAEELMEEVTEETFKKVGPFEDFKEGEGAVSGGTEEKSSCAEGDAGCSGGEAEKK